MLRKFRCCHLYLLKQEDEIFTIYGSNEAVAVMGKIECGFLKFVYESLADF